MTAPVPSPDDLTVPALQPRTYLVPIGLDLGVYPQPDGTALHMIFVANEETDLPEAEYRAWRLAAAAQDGLLHTADGLTTLASSEGIADAGAVIERLRRRRLLLDLTPMTEQSWEFAALTNLRPRVVGLGVVADSDEIAVGVNDFTVDQLIPEIFDVLMWSHLDGMLLEGARRVALLGRGRERNRTSRWILESLYVYLPDLLSKGAAWIDHVDPTLAMQRLTPQNGDTHA